MFVGRGARSYDLIGKWVPDGIVGWMMTAGKTNGGDGAEEEGLESSAKWEKVDEEDDRYVHPRNR